ncbi:cholecystokinin [Thomomys bottae]
MKAALPLCLLLAALTALTAGAPAQPVPQLPPDNAGGPGPREAPPRQPRALARPDGEARARLGAVLARYIQQARRAPSGRASLLKSLQGLDPSHRIIDRDYVGWMDFGRRSAEDQDYDMAS